jgi:transcription elongation factor GreB
VPDDPERVYFGAVVQLADDAGEVLELRIVGPDEFDASAGRISIESPLGRALIGRREGDEFRFQRPKGAVTYSVVRVRYEA